MPEKEQMFVCPYNCSHLVVQHKLSTHISKCRKAYVASDHEKAICSFNSTHVFPKPEIKFHEENVCSDRRKLDEWMYSCEEEGACGPAIAPMVDLNIPPPSENWDNINCESYLNYKDEQNNAKEIYINKNGLSKSKRKQKKVSERLRLQQVKEQNQQLLTRYTAPSTSANSSDEDGDEGIEYVTDEEEDQFPESFTPAPPPVFKDDFYPTGLNSEASNYSEASGGLDFNSKASNFQLPPFHTETPLNLKLSDFPLPSFGRGLNPTAKAYSPKSPRPEDCSDFSSGQKPKFSQVPDKSSKQGPYGEEEEFKVVTPRSARGGRGRGKRFQ